MNKKIRVLVVDDSAFMRKIIADILQKDGRMEVVGTARDGAEGVERFKELVPDVVTLDVEMPKKNGIEALKEMMNIRSTPVVMVSAVTQAGAEITLKALSLGAVDFITKPSGSISLDMDKISDEVCNKVVMASKANIRAAARASSPHPPLQPMPVIDRRGKHIDVVVIASSTGGPKALQEVIPSIPASFPVPIFIVQHMPAGFTRTFASRLNGMSGLEVAEASEGLKVKKGMAVIAPGGLHLTIGKSGGEFVCHLQDTPPVRSVKPAADVLFSSAAACAGGNILAAIMTGMGRDGTDGARAIKEKGGIVIAESKETCVVYGMPRSAEEAGLVDEFFPLGNMNFLLQKLVS